jgi:hypothetical protein
MSILDRPLFQRRPTREQLRQYGLPAFANGGIVQKFANGGESSTNPFGIDLGYTGSGAISGKPGYQIGGPLTREEYENLSPEEVFKIYYGTEPKITSDSILSSLQNYLAERRPSGALDATMKLEEEMREREVKGGAADIRKEFREKEDFKTIGEIAEEISTGEEGTTRVPPAEEEKKKLLEEAEKKKTYTEPGGLDSTKSLEEEIKKEVGEDFSVTGKGTASGAGGSEVQQERSRMSKLQDLVKERSAMYKELLGDPREQLRQQGFLQLAQFGLNLAAARGGNLAEKIAKSATDPLQTFAALARDAAKDERAITAAAIEAGEKQLTTEIETAADISNFGKTIADISRIKNIPLEEAYAEYERLNEDEPETLSNLEKWSLAGEAAPYGGDAGKARAVQIIPSSLVRSTELILNEEKTGYDKGKVSLIGENAVFGIPNEKGQIVPATIKPGALQEGKKKDPITLDDFEILEDVEIVRF